MKSKFNDQGCLVGTQQNFLFRTFFHKFTEVFDTQQIEYLGSYTGTQYRYYINASPQLPAGYYVVDFKYGVT